jgi:FkbM family methyltransferase
MKKYHPCILGFHKHFGNGSLIMLDVGARWGLQRPWNQYPNEFIQYYGFDADQEECDRLNQSIKTKNVRYIPAALSDENSLETLHITHEPGRSSIYKPNVELLNKFYDGEGFKVASQLKIETTTLNQVILDYNINPDFIKLDTQGAELRIIKGGDKIMDRVLGFEIEVEFLEFYKKQPLFSDVDKYMKSSGFELYDLNRYWAKRRTMGPDHSNRGQIAFCDAIYLRSVDGFYSMKHLSETDLFNKFIKLINILTLYGFHDVAIDLIDHQSSPLDDRDKNWVKDLLLSYSHFPAWQRFLFNNRFAQKLGILFYCLGNLFSYQTKTAGWGTDYNTFHGRYAYHTPESIVRLFGRK